MFNLVIAVLSILLTALALVGGINYLNTNASEGAYLAARSTSGINAISGSLLSFKLANQGAMPQSVAWLGDVQPYMPQSPDLPNGFHWNFTRAADATPVYCLTSDEAPSDRAFNVMTGLLASTSNSFLSNRCDGAFVSSASIDRTSSVSVNFVQEDISADLTGDVFSSGIAGYQQIESALANINPNDPNWWADVLLAVRPSLPITAPVGFSWASLSTNSGNYFCLNSGRAISSQSYAGLAAIVSSLPAGTASIQNGCVGNVAVSIPYNSANSYTIVFAE